jgi:hypothetical protein
LLVLSKFFNSVIKILLDFRCLFQSILGRSIGSDKRLTGKNFLDEPLNFLLLLNNFLSELVYIFLLFTDDLLFLLVYLRLGISDFRMNGLNLILKLGLLHIWI